jgi:hypothetical protein
MTDEQVGVAPITGFGIGPRQTQCQCDTVGRSEAAHKRERQAFWCIARSSDFCGLQGASGSFMNVIRKKKSVAHAAPALPAERAPAPELASGSLELGSLCGATGRIGGGIKMAPGGPRKPLKRLDTDKGIKVNSKENPTKIQTIPRIFQGFSKESKDFQGTQTRVASARFDEAGNPRGSRRPPSAGRASPHGTMTAAPSRRPARKSSSAWLAFSSG